MVRWTFEPLQTSFFAVNLLQTAPDAVDEENSKPGPDGNPGSSRKGLHKTTRLQPFELAMPSRCVYATNLSIPIESLKPRLSKTYVEYLYKILYIYIYICPKPLKPNNAQYLYHMTL